MIQDVRYAGVTWMHPGDARHLEECKKEDCPHCRLIREREAALADPQHNRIGVKGDPTPDAEYGDRRG